MLSRLENTILTELTEGMQVSDNDRPQQVRYNYFLEETQVLVLLPCQFYSDTPQIFWEFSPLDSHICSQLDMQLVQPKVKGLHLKYQWRIYQKHNWNKKYFRRIYQKCSLRIIRNYQKLPEMRMEIYLIFSWCIYQMNYNRIMYQTYSCII